MAEAIMTMSLRSRVTRLASQAQPGARCPTCGVYGGHGVERAFNVTFEGDGEEDLGGPDSCPTCGRVRVLRITFDPPGSITEQQDDQEERC